MHSWAPLHVLHGDADVLFPVSGVGSYGPAGRCLPIPPFLLSQLWLEKQQEWLGYVCRWQGWESGRESTEARAQGSRGLLSSGATETALLAEPGYFEVLSPE